MKKSNIYSVLFLLTLFSCKENNSQIKIDTQSIDSHTNNIPNISIEKK